MPKKYFYAFHQESGNIEGPFRSEEEAMCSHEDDEEWVIALGLYEQKTAVRRTTTWKKMT